MRQLVLALLVLAAVAPAAAQEQAIRDANLPRSLETRLLRMYGGAAERMDGPVDVTAGVVRAGDLAVVGGPLRVAGRVEGDVAMVGGDVVVEPGGEITGSVVVVGGQVRVSGEGTVGGTVTAYGGAGDAETPRSRRVRDRRVDRDDSGFARLSVRPGVSYNRVEGLPILFGPVLETDGALPLRVEAFGVWRTHEPEVGGPGRTGYQVRVEQFLARGRALGLGGTAYSVVGPVERWQVTDLEASLGTLLFNEDLRDHFERTGWGAFVRARPFRGLEARVTYRDEVHESLASGDPWALFHRSRAPRLQPLLAEGRIRTLEGGLDLDLRDHRSEPRSGWLVRLSVERPMAGDLTRPELVLSGAGPGVLEPAEVDLDFTTGFLDLRRYSPIGDHAQLNLRGVVGGSLAERLVPAQYQHALGGPGTLPGFALFHGDCGARALAGHQGDAVYFSGYGCDRFALGQAEYRGALSLDFGFFERSGESRHDWWDVDLRADPTWVVFANIGRGWAYGEPDSSEVTGTGTLADVGMGVQLGRLGVFGAVPVTNGVDQSPRFFVRWGPRF
jgi:hypothetical protein